MSKAALFIDTNIHLHFPPLPELDLPSVLGTRDFTIIVTGVVLRELDEQKLKNPSTKVKERIRKILRELDNACTNASVLPGGLQVEFFDEYPANEMAEFMMNPHWPDNILLATAIAYSRQNPEQEIFLLTHDTALRLKCRATPVKPIGLDDGLILLPEKSTEEKKNKELLQKLAVFESQIPRLEAVFVGINNETDSLAILECEEPRPLDSIALEETIEELRYKHPLHDIPNNWFSGIGVSSITDISPQQWARYNQELEEYFADMRAYYADVYGYQVLKERSFSMNVRVKNTGAKPAEHVDVSLTFPIDVQVYRQDDFPAEPERPVLPAEPKSPFQDLTQPSYLHSPYLGRGLRDLLPNSTPQIQIQQEGGHPTLAFEMGMIKHTKSHDLPAFHMILPPFDEAKSFGIEYSIIAANIPEPFTGTLHVKVSKTLRRKVTLVIE